MTAVSKPKRSPPSAPTTVALRRLGLSFIGFLCSRRRGHALGAYRPLHPARRQVRAEGTSWSCRGTPPPDFARRGCKRLKTNEGTRQKRAKRNQEAANRREHRAWLPPRRGCATQSVVVRQTPPSFCIDVKRRELRKKGF